MEERLVVLSERVSPDNLYLRYTSALSQLRRQDADWRMILPGLLSRRVDGMWSNLFSQLGCCEDKGLLRVQMGFLIRSYSCLLIGIKSPGFLFG